MTTWDNLEQFLQPFDLRRESDGQYRCNSPLRPGSNSHAVHIKVGADGEHGAIKDHAGDFEGSLYDFVDALGVPRAGITRIETTKRAYRDIDEYAAAHGIDSWVLIAAGWSEDIVTRKDKRGKLRPALTFKTSGGMRFRYIDGDPEGETYTSVWGYKRCLYRLNEAVEKARDYGWSALIFDNGEVSTAVAQHFKLPAFCMPGGETSSMPQALIDQIKAVWTGEIIVALDCDPKGRKSAEGMVKCLTAAGFPARAVDLGLSTGGDLADLCKLHGEGVGEVVKHLPALGGKPEPAAPPSAMNMRKKRRIIHADELKNLPPLAWLIEGMILDNGLNMIYGESGHGKSFIALDWALTLAQTMDVMYYAREGLPGFESRCDAWQKAHHKTRGKLHFDLDSIDLMDKQQVDWLIEDVKETGIKPRLFIFDTLSRSMETGNENDTANAVTVVGQANRIQDAFGCAVLLVHHKSKGAKEERGSTVFRASMDCMVRVEKDDDTIKVESAKIKDGEPFKPFDLRLVKFGDSVVPMPSEKVVSMVGQPLTNSQRKVLEFLALEVFRNFGARSAQIRDDSGVHPNSMWRVISELGKLGYLRRPANKNEPFIITDLGHQMLARQQPAQPS